MLPTGTHVSHTSQQLGDKPHSPALEPLPPTELESHETGCLPFPFSPNGLQSRGEKAKILIFIYSFLWHLSAPDDKGLNWTVSPGQHQHGCNMHPTTIQTGLALQTHKLHQIFPRAHPQCRNEPRSQDDSHPSSSCCLSGLQHLAGPFPPAETVAELCCKHTPGKGAGGRWQPLPAIPPWSLWLGFRSAKPASNFALGEVICLQMLCG